MRALLVRFLAAAATGLYLLVHGARRWWRAWAAPVGGTLLLAVGVGLLMGVGAGLVVAGALVLVGDYLRSTR